MLRLYILNMLTHQCDSNKTQYQDQRKALVVNQDSQKDKQLKHEIHLNNIKLYILPLYEPMDQHCSTINIILIWNFHKRRPHTVSKSTNHIIHHIQPDTNLPQLITNSHLSKTLLEILINEPRECQQAQSTGTFIFP